MNIDKLTYAGNLGYSENFLRKTIFKNIDILDYKLEQCVFDFKPDTICILQLKSC